MQGCGANGLGELALAVRDRPSQTPTQLPDRRQNSEQNSLITNLSHYGDDLIASFKGLDLNELSVLSQCTGHSRQNTALIMLNIDF